MSFLSEREDSVLPPQARAQISIGLLCWHNVFVAHAGLTQSLICLIVNFVCVFVLAGSVF